jgi:hypothetical protein
MSSPQPPQQPKRCSNHLTQAVQTIQARVNFNALALKPNARVPELLVQDAGAAKAEVYPLLGDRYLLGRSSKSCDIVVRNPVVSQIHLSLERYGRRQRHFIIKTKTPRTGFIEADAASLPSYCATVTSHDWATRTGGCGAVEYVDPPPWYILAIRYALYGIGGLTALLVFDHRH